jgi:hypothetical protein
MMDKFPSGIWKKNATAVLTRDYDKTILAESRTFRAKPEGQSCYADCHDFIYTDQTCYSPEHDYIYVTFEKCVPREDDRIAIYYDYEAKSGEN